MPIIVGAPRSGTTLLRFMLDSHSTLAIPPETGFLPAVYALKQTGRQTRADFFDVVTTFSGDPPAWVDFGLDARHFWKELEQLEPFDLSEGLRIFYRLYASKQNKPRYGDKTPTYCEHIQCVEELLPEAHFIHIIRDGRDACMSLRPLNFSPASDIRTLALYWRNLVEAGRKAGDAARAYMELRYEDLVREPQLQLESICRFLDLSFEPGMLLYWERTPERLKEHKSKIRQDGTVVISHEQRLRQQLLTIYPPQPGRVFNWKREMSCADRAEFIRYAGDTLDELGYEV